MRNPRKKLLPSSSEISSHMVLLDYQYRPSQILNIETLHQQQLAFSLRSAHYHLDNQNDITKSRKHGWQGNLSKTHDGT